MPDNSEVSKLIDDLSSLPNIVGGLGLSIASAQKAFNLDYLNNVERLLGLVKATLGSGTSNFEEVVKDMLKALAPPRYQYTETELEFRADLAQSLKVEAGGSLGVGVGAVTVSATAALGFGYDYQASARVRTVIHAVPADEAAFTALLERASKLKSVDLPERTDVGVDEKIHERAVAIHNALAQPADAGGGV